MVKQVTSPTASTTETAQQNSPVQSAVVDALSSASMPSTVEYAGAESNIEFSTTIVTSQRGGVTILHDYRRAPNDVGNDGAKLGFPTSEQLNLTGEGEARVNSVGVGAKGNELSSTAKVHSTLSLSA